MEGEYQSLFVGPKNQKNFGVEDPFYVPEPSRWNRALYYSRPNPELVAVEPMNLVVDPYRPDQVEGLSGIWELWGRRARRRWLVCLDVHETLDVGYEIRMHQMDLDRVKNLPWDAEEFHPLHLFSLDKRSKVICQWLDLQVRVTALQVEGKLNRELLEAQRAWDTRSVYWNRNYFQPVTQEQRDHQRTVEYIAGRR